MSNAYFRNIPLVQYQGKYARNVILRAKFIDSVIQNYYAFYPYVIKDGQTAEQIAYDYYGDCDLDWLVWFSNQVVDPYYEWPMKQDLLDTYIDKKYGDFVTAVETVHHYVYNKSVEPSDPNQNYIDDFKMTPETYSFLDTIEKSYWKPVTCYDYEFQLNESKRTIQLVDNDLLDQILREISEVMK